MREKILAIIQYAFFLGLGLFLLWYSSRNLSPAQLEQMKFSIREANFLMGIPVFIVFIVSHYSRAVRWKLLMEPTGMNPSLKNTFAAVIMGYFFNLLLPRLGEIMKCTILAKYEDVKVDKLIGTMVAERAIDLICLVIIMFFTIVLQIDLIGSYATAEFRNIWETKFNLTSIVIFILLLLATIFMLMFLFKRLAHLSIVVKIKKISAGIWEGLISVTHVKRKDLFLFHTILIWAMYLLGIQLGFWAMQAVSHLGIKESLSLLSFGSIAMIATQGGIGAYQLIVQKTLILYGIDEVNGLAFGWMIWIFQTMLMIIIGLIVMLILPIMNKKNLHEQRQTDF